MFYPYLLLLSLLLSFSRSAGAFALPPLRSLPTSLRTATEPPPTTLPTSPSSTPSPGECPPPLPTPVSFVAETTLPTPLGTFRLRAYKVPLSPWDPVAIYYTPPSPRSMVRVHSQCLTSEVFGSQRCDCREQLEMSLRHIKEHGGAVVYLQQEGRGIGLANKIAAYKLQDEGYDTVDANLHLGFGEDERDYGVVPGILSDLGITEVDLMSNNPLKRESLEALGVNVVNSTPLVPVVNVNNAQYLRTKVERMAHENLADVLMAPRRPAPVAAPPAPAPKKAARLPEKLDGVVAAEDGYCFGKQSVVDCIAAVGRGEIVVVVDDMDRENEGDFIMAADKATPETLATIVRYSSGVICVAMEGERMDALKLPPMVSLSEDPKGTAFSVSVDASQANGITTGISAAERAITCNLLGAPSTDPVDLVRPGHIFPLRAREGGVLTRDGHTEATVDLARLSGCSPAGVLCEIVSEEDVGHMARLPELIRFAEREGMVITSIADLKQYRIDEGV